MRSIIIIFSILFYSWGVSAGEKNQVSLDKTIKEYRVYSLARCIGNNYKKMGVDFNKLPLTDNTVGFIDIDMGLAFSAERNNELDKFIEVNTGYFYQPKQQSGDLASINLVVYDCVDFYHSIELKRFLKELIQKSETDL
ncbi:hypothetical protein [Serratia sp. DD3]|uniref:hypothetical protein n=1 Tax=Serratia sp. DD3 TaxID=1410619 RepID=UPI0004D8FF1E|nr:hypothetical protein [Serratia sp. DD3]KEY57105.1 hypothetical protein SRDD_39800 [Serratia sp. DD3]